MKGSQKTFQYRSAKLQKIYDQKTSKQKPANPISKFFFNTKRLNQVVTICSVICVLFFLYEIYLYKFMGHHFYPVQGIDVSHHRGEIDWQKVKKNNFSFVYIKSTEGSGFRDKHFVQNWQQAKSIGLVVGAYHFYSFCSDPALQANNFISVVPRASISLPPAIDLEFSGNCNRRPSPYKLVRDLDLFVSILEGHYNRTPLIYFTRNFYDVYGKSLNKYQNRWISSVRNKPDYSQWTFWQHSVWGRVSGINGNTDLNVFNGSSMEFYLYSRSFMDTNTNSIQASGFFPGTHKILIYQSAKKY